MTAYFKKIPYDLLQKERNSVLSCSIEDIHKAAAVIRAAVEKCNVCVIGNEKHIKDDAGLFDDINVLS